MRYITAYLTYCFNCTPCTSASIQLLEVDNGGPDDDLIIARLVKEPCGEVCIDHKGELLISKPMATARDALKDLELRVRGVAEYGKDRPHFGFNERYVTQSTWSLV